MNKNQEYLLFMVKEGTGRYMTLNYDEGRFILEDGQISSVYYNPDWEDKGVMGISCISGYDPEDVMNIINQVLHQPQPLELDSDVDNHEYITRDAPVNLYSSWQALMQESDVVCAVTIGDYHNGYTEENGPAGHYFMSSVTEVYAGNIQDGSVKLRTFSQYADSGTEMTLYEDIDDPWMNEGEQYLVFLEADSDGLYRIVGNAQGRFAIEDGKITALKYLYPTRVTQGLDVQSLPLKDWQTEMGSLLDAG